MNTDDLEKVYYSVYNNLTGKNAFFTAKYYRYAGLKSTIQGESLLFFKKKFVLKLSTGFKDFPETFHIALAYILISKATRKKCPPRYRKIYRKWMNLESSEEVHNRLKRDYGHKQEHNPVGMVYDLEDSFLRMNESI